MLNGRLSVLSLHMRTSFLETTQNESSSYYELAGFPIINMRAGGSVE